MSEYKYKAHTLCAYGVMYQYYCTTLYVQQNIEEISMRYEIEFLEIGADKNHVHFLIQSVPNMSPTEIIKKVKSITAREIFKRNPEVKKELWGGNFWTSGLFVNTAGTMKLVFF